MTSYEQHCAVGPKYKICLHESPCSQYVCADGAVYGVWPVYRCVVYTDEKLQLSVTIMLIQTLQ